MHLINDHFFGCVQWHSRGNTPILSKATSWGLQSDLHPARWLPMTCTHWKPVLPSPSPSLRAATSCVRSSAPTQQPSSSHPPPIVITFPGPILRSFPQQSVVASSRAPAFGGSSTSGACIGLGSLCSRTLYDSGALFGCRSGSSALSALRNRYSSPFSSHFYSHWYSQLF